jgi:hypothetical protein
MIFLIILKIVKAFYLQNSLVLEILETELLLEKLVLLTMLVKLLENIDHLFTIF